MSEWLNTINKTLSSATPSFGNDKKSTTPVTTDAQGRPVAITNNTGVNGRSVPPALKPKAKADPLADCTSCKIPANKSVPRSPREKTAPCATGDGKCTKGSTGNKQTYAKKWGFEAKDRNAGLGSADNSEANKALDAFEKGDKKSVTGFLKGLGGQSGELLKEMEKNGFSGKLSYKAAYSEQGNNFTDSFTVCYRGKTYNLGGPKSDDKCNGGNTGGSANRPDCKDERRAFNADGTDEERRAFGEENAEQTRVVASADTTETPVQTQTQTQLPPPRVVPDTIPESVD